MKNCKICNLNPRRNKSSSYCKSCHNDIQKAAYKKRPYSIRESSKRKKIAIREIVIKAKDKECADCGIKYPYYVMDLDHVRGDKKYNLSVAASKSRAINSVQSEIDKCDVVCANCHRERTFSRMEK